jgi:hypothetical protein
MITSPATEDHPLQPYVSQLVQVADKLVIVVTQHFRVVL